jgi:hypothetical protein
MRDGAACPHNTLLSKYTLYIYSAALNNRFKEPDLHGDIIDADRDGRLFLGQP